MSMIVFVPLLLTSQLMLSEVYITLIIYGYFLLVGICVVFTVDFGNAVWVSMGRISSFLLMPEMGEWSHTLGSPSASSEPSILMNNCDFEWDNGDAVVDDVDDSEKAFAADSDSDDSQQEMILYADNADPHSSLTLRDISLDLTGPILVTITGRVGSGKTSLLHAIIGSLPLCNGYHNNHLSITGRLCFVSSRSWLLLGRTIRSNIMFGSAFSPPIYHSVTSACCLLPDFHSLADGDQTVLGEKGINISGGQKARITMARAVYHVLANNGGGGGQQWRCSITRLRVWMWRWRRGCGGGCSAGRGRGLLVGV